MPHIEHPNAHRTRLAVYVRLSPEEHSDLEKDEKATGLSPAILLKRSYFDSKKPSIVMPPEERKAWFTELRRWGSNLNQLARRVNSGLMEGWYQEFETIAKRLALIETKIVSVYGNN